MTNDDLIAALADAGVDGVTIDESFGGTTIDVRLEHWFAAAITLRDDPRVGARFFDWLSAYDDRDAGLAVVLHVWSRSQRQAVTVRTHVDRVGGALPTLTGVWAGADWHERETFEMFDIEFAGHPNLVPLLLPDRFEGNPLRKEFVLASRVAKQWPGESEPREPTEGSAARRRRPMRPPGVPDPGTWGPEALET